MGGPVCYKCKGLLAESGLGVVCPHCGSVNFVAPDDRAVAHLHYPLAPLDPGALLAERLGRMGIPCTVERSENLWAPCYLFTPADGKPVWRAAYADVARRFYEKLPPPQRRLVPFQTPERPYRLIEPTITPSQAESHLLRRGSESLGRHETALVHLPVQRLWYEAGERRGVALAVAERIFLETPPRPTGAWLFRLRLYFGSGTAAVVLFAAVAFGGFWGAAVSLAAGLVGTVLFGRVAHSG